MYLSVLFGVHITNIPALADICDNSGFFITSSFSGFGKLHDPSLQPSHLLYFFLVSDTLNAREKSDVFPSFLPVLTDKRSLHP